MFLGLIFFGVGCLILWALIGYMQLIISAIGWICRGIGFLTVEIYTYFFVTKQLQESGALEARELEKRLEEAEEKEADQQHKLAQQNRIVQAGLINLNQLRIKYPYAEEELFQTFIKKFASYSVAEIKQMEEQIKKSHIANELKYATSFQDEYKYTLADVNGLEPMDEKCEDPLVMKVYKVKSDYILHIKDKDANSHSLLQSKDYMAIAKMMVVVVDRMRELRQQKKNIQSMNLNILFDNVVHSTQSFRRNKMNFLD
jgi:hypothetical protein